MSGAGAPLVIGIGNIYRGDDALGLLAARLVRQQAGDRCTVLELDGEGAALMDAWCGAGVVLVVDAVRSGVAPGTLVRLDASVTPITACHYRGSHAFGLGEAVELSRLLSSLPGRLVIHGVEGGDFSLGEGLSPPVRASLPPLVTAVLDELRRELT